MNKHLYHEPIPLIPKKPLVRIESNDILVELENYIRSFGIIGAFEVAFNLHDEYILHKENLCTGATSYSKAQE